MRKLTALGAILAALSVAVSPSSAHTPDEKIGEILKNFDRELSRIRSMREISSTDPARDGQLCTKDLDALLQRYIDTVESNLRCDVEGRNQIVIYGGYWQKSAAESS